MSVVLVHESAIVLYLSSEQQTVLLTATDVSFYTQQAGNRVFREVGDKNFSRNNNGGPGIYGPAVSGYKTTAFARSISVTINYSFQFNASSIAPVPYKSFRDEVFHRARRNQCLGRSSDRQLGLRLTLKFSQLPSGETLRRITHVHKYCSKLTDA